MVVGIINFNFQVRNLYEWLINEMPQLQGFNNQDLKDILISLFSQVLTPNMDVFGFLFRYLYGWEYLKINWLFNIYTCC